jgi:hypothetical protein
LIFFPFPFKGGLREAEGGHEIQAVVSGTTYGLVVKGIFQQKNEWLIIPLCYLTHHALDALSFNDHQQIDDQRYWDFDFCVPPF